MVVPEREKDTHARTDKEMLSSYPGWCLPWLPSQKQVRVPKKARTHRQANSNYDVAQYFKPVGMHAGRSEGFISYFGALNNL